MNLAILLLFFVVLQVISAVPFDSDDLRKSQDDEELYFSASESENGEGLKDTEEDFGGLASPIDVSSFSSQLSLSSSLDSLPASPPGLWYSSDIPSSSSSKSRKRVMFDLTKNRMKIIPNRHQKYLPLITEGSELAADKYDFQSRQYFDIDDDDDGGHDEKEHEYFKEEFPDYTPWKDEWSYQDGTAIFSSYWDAYFFVAQVKRLFYRRELEYKINSKLVGRFGDSEGKGSYWHPDGGKQLVTPYIGVRFSDKKLRWECYVPNHKRQIYGIGSFGTSREAALGFNYLRQLLRKRNILLPGTQLNSFQSWEHEYMDTANIFMQIDDYLSAVPPESFI